MNMLRSRVVRSLAFLFAVTLTAQANTPTPKVVHQLTHYHVGDKVKLKLINHTAVQGNITEITGDSIAIRPKHAAQPTLIPLANVTTIHDRSSLGSRFVMGPCVGPITLAIAAPFITAIYISGH